MKRFSRLQWNTSDECLPAKRIQLVTAQCPPLLHLCRTGLHLMDKRERGKGEREENTANQKEEWKTERTKRVAGKSICVAQSWSAVGKEG